MHRKGDLPTARLALTLAHYELIKVRSEMHVHRRRWGTWQEARDCGQLACFKRAWMTFAALGGPANVLVAMLNRGCGEYWR